MTTYDQPAFTRNFTDGPFGHFAIHIYRSLPFLHCNQINEVHLIPKGDGRKETVLFVSREGRKRHLYFCVREVITVTLGRKGI